MKTVRNSVIPLKGFKAINLFGVLFVRKEFFPLDAVDERHEMIHTKQMKETLYIGFYLWYLTEWLVKLFVYRDCKDAYRNVSFEREARRGEQSRYYFQTRRNFAWLKMLKGGEA